ncbi:MAG: hypothetical protein ACTHMP_15975 [Thermomicrobiales bacterium]
MVVDWLLVALALALFVAVAAHQWRLPGLYNDEAYDVVPAMQLVLGQSVDLNRGVGLHLFGHDLPLMISDYQGVSSTYTVLPLFAIFGVGVGPVRAMTIGFAALAILLTYPFGRALFGRAAGVLAVWLLACSPSLIFWSRVGVYVVIQVVPLALGANLCFLRWRRSARTGVWPRAGRHDWWLALAGLLVGIGLSTKILFLWYIFGALAGVIAVRLVAWRWPDNGARPKPFSALFHEPLPLTCTAALAALGGLLLGAAPLLGYNLASGGTIKVILANLGHTEKGVNNADVVSNLLHQAGAFQVVLDGSYFWWLGRVHTNFLTTPVFVLSTFGLLALVCLAPAYRRWRNTVVFLLTFLAAVFVQSAFTLSGLEPTHLLIMLPLPQLIIAAFAALGGHWLADLLRARHVAALLHRLAPVVLVALLVPPISATDLVLDARYHQDLAQSGGKSSFSASIYDLAHFLNTPHRDIFDYQHPIALDWGMKYNLQLLTAGRVNPQEVYGKTTDLPPNFDATLTRLFADPSVLYLAHRIDGEGVPAANPAPAREFLRLAAAQGKVVVPLKVIYESGGAPLFYVYFVRAP